MLEYTEDYRGIQKIAGVYRRLLRYTEDYRGIQKNTEVYRRIPRYTAKVCRKLLNFEVEFLCAYQQKLWFVLQKNLDVLFYSFCKHVLIKLVLQTMKGVISQLVLVQRRIQSCKLTFTNPGLATSTHFTTTVGRKEGVGEKRGSEKRGGRRKEGVREKRGSEKRGGQRKLTL